MIILFHFGFISLLDQPLWWNWYHDNFVIWFFLFYACVHCYYVILLFWAYDHCQWWCFHFLHYSAGSYILPADFFSLLWILLIYLSICPLSMMIWKLYMFICLMFANYVASYVAQLERKKTDRYFTDVMIILGCCNYISSSYDHCIYVIHVTWLVFCWLHDFKAIIHVIWLVFYCMPLWTMRW